MTTTNNFYFKNSKPNYNPDKKIQVDHLILDLDFDLESDKLSGNTKLYCTALQNEISVLKLNACEMDIHKVLVDNSDINFNYDGEFLNLELNENLELQRQIIIQIDYSITNPKKGIIFCGKSFESNFKSTQVWTQGESEEGRYWHPCFDYPNQIFTSETIITVDNKYTALSNGKLIDKTNIEKKVTYHWKMDKPHPNYLVTIAIGEFSVFKDKWRSKEICYYTSKKYEQNLELLPTKTPKMLEFFSTKYGLEYPWNKYDQVWMTDFIWGGMENTTLTINTERALFDVKMSRDYKFGEVLIAHELAHQWFGDLVVVNHWADLWIKEGAATYAEQLWVEHEYGKDEADYYRYQELETYLEATKSQYQRPTSTIFYSSPEDLYDDHSYTKAGLVYHMIRKVIGNDELYTKFNRDFLISNQHRCVNPFDLIRSAELTTGRNIKPLIDQYINRPGHPKITFNYFWDGESKFIKLSIIQTQVDSKDKNATIFDLKDFPLNFYYLDKDQIKIDKIVKKQVKLTKPEEIYYFQLDSKPDFVCLDPEGDYLKELLLEIPDLDLRNIIQYSDTVYSKLIALTSIGKKHNLANLNNLIQAYRNEKFWAIRAKTVEVISNIQLTQTDEFIINEAIKDADHRVRIKAIKYLSKIYSTENFNLILDIYKKEKSSYLLENTAIICLAKIANRLGAEHINIIKSLINQVLSNKEGGFDENTKIAALHSLSELIYDKEAMKIVLEFTNIENPKPLIYSSLKLLGKFKPELDSIEETKIRECLLENANKRDFMIERSLLESCSESYDLWLIRVVNKIKNSTHFHRNQKKAETVIINLQSKMKNNKLYIDIFDKVEKLETKNKELLSRVEQMEQNNKKL
jgi:aminopeptidase N